MCTGIVSEFVKAVVIAVDVLATLEESSLAFGRNDRNGGNHRRVVRRKLKDDEGNDSGLPCASAMRIAVAIAMRLSNENDHEMEQRFMLLRSFGFWRT